MKYLVTILALLAYFSGLSQTRVLIGLEPTTGRPGYIYRDTLRSLNLRSPLYKYNDSTIAINDTISGFTKNTGRDSIILTLANGQRFAAKDSVGGTPPAGLTGHIQFNYGGAFAASPNLFWDSTNKSLGLGTNTPAYIVTAIQNLNNSSRISLRNTSTGAAAQSVFESLNDLNFGFQAGTFGSGFTSSGLSLPNLSFVQGNQTPLLLRTTGAGYSIRFAGGNTGNSEYMRLFSNGALGINTTTDSLTAKLIVNGDITPLGGAIVGNSTSGGNLILRSTSNATKGKILFGASGAYDEINNRLGLGTATPAYIIEGTENVNGISRYGLKNTNAGTAAQAIMQISNNLDNALQLGMTSSAFTTAGPLAAGTGYIQVNSGTLLIRTSGALPIIFAVNASIEAFRILSTGALLYPATNTAAGTTGARTINQIAGSVNVAGAGTTLVVTNSLVTTASLIFLQVYGTDATAKSATVTVAAGSFTITLNAAATAETKVAWHVIN